MNHPLVYLANGKLRTLIPGASAQAHESPFAADLFIKARKEQQRHAWKQSGEGNLIPSAALWGKGSAEKPINISLTSLARGSKPGEFIYTLRTDHVCAILSFQTAKSEEQRLWNNNLKRINHLDVHPTLGHVACSVEQNAGGENIGIRLADDSGIAEVTEGDSIDTAPTWAPGDDLVLVFQSAGLGRNKDGFITGVAPFSIQRLDVLSGEMITLAEDPAHDYLNPRITADGALYFIRRPHTPSHRPSFATMLKDTIVFPFRLARAVFGFLNFFSMMYSGRQLKTVKQDGARNVDLPHMLIYGNLIKAQSPAEENAGATLVPRSWQLIRRDTFGRDEVLAESVLCYDIAADGSVFHSNGSTIFSRTPDGKAREIARDRMIQQIVTLKPLAN